MFLLNISNHCSDKDEISAKVVNLLLFFFNKKKTNWQLSRKIRLYRNIDLKCLKETHFSSFVSYRFLWDKRLRNCTLIYYLILCSNIDISLYLICQRSLWMTLGRTRTWSRTPTSRSILSCLIIFRCAVWKCLRIYKFSNVWRTELRS